MDNLGTVIVVTGLIVGIVLLIGFGPLVEKVPPKIQEEQPIDLPAIELYEERAEVGLATEEKEEKPVSTEGMPEWLKVDKEASIRTPTKPTAGSSWDNDTPKPKPTPRSQTTTTTHWATGGNLHNATVEQWKRATYQNKLATAADWLAATEWKNHLKVPADFDRLKVKAQMLVNAVDKVVAGKETDSLQLTVTEIAAALVVMSNDLGP